MASCLYPSPWSRLDLPPWFVVFIHHHGHWSFSITVASGLYPSPWPLVFIHHHDLCSLSITMASGLYPSPWPAVFIHHHGRWSLSITMTSCLYCYHDLLLLSSRPLTFIHHKLFVLYLRFIIQHLAPSFSPPSMSIIRNLPNIATVA